ncbi:MAG: Crp/Fnr family transcriptional regulator [Magnetospiraceae bacterium]
MELVELFNQSAFQKAVTVTEMPVEAGDVILAEGHPNTHVYAVLSGTARVSVDVDLGEDRHFKPGFADIDQGNIFGEMSLFGAETASATVAAGPEGCTVALVETAALRHYLDANPLVGYPILRHMLEIMTQRLSSGNKHVKALFAWALKAHKIDQDL